MRRLLAAGCLALLTACGSNAVEPEPSDLADLRPYVGQEVTVTAEVAGLQSPRAFTIITEEGAGGEPLLVVHEQQEPVDEDLPVTVTGTVRIFDAQDVLLGAEDTARLVQYDGQPYLDADRVTAPKPE